MRWTRLLLTCCRCWLPLFSGARECRVMFALLYVMFVDLWEVREQDEFTPLTIAKSTKKSVRTSTLVGTVTSTGIVPTVVIPSPGNVTNDLSVC